MVMTYLTLLVLFVLPIGLQGYLQMFASVTSEQLSALTVTSPFSAALSVPMHTTRSDAWINQPVGVADTALVPITRNIRMPVYAVFLCIYPVLGLVFFGVAYLAFRWRWWRQAGSVRQSPRLDRRPGSSCVTPECAVLKIPHPVRPPHQGDCHRDHVDRTCFALTCGTQTFSVYCALIRTLPALLSALKSATSKTSGVSVRHGP